MATGLLLIVTFATALLITVGIMPVIIKLAKVYKLYDLPDLPSSVDKEPLSPSRRIHKLPVPRLGGLGIFAGFFLTILIWLPVKPMVTFLLPSVILFGMGLADDLFHLKAKHKLLIQVIISGLVIWLNDLTLQTLVITPDVFITLPAIVGACLSVFIVVGSINAVNMVDGLDGLAGGIVLIGISLLCYVHFLNTGDIHLILMIGIPLMGALLGFLKFNTHPASIFMGDGGSNWLGFMLGILLLFILGNYQIDGLSSEAVFSRSLDATDRVPFITAVMCLALPIFDTGSVIFHRIVSGLNPMSADKRHFHHGLLRIGLSQSQSVTAIYFIAVIIGIAGISPIAFPTYNFWWLPYLAALALISMVQVVIVVNDKTLQAFSGGRVLLTDSRKQLGGRIKKAIRYWETFNRYAIYGLLCATPIFAGIPNTNLGFAAMGMGSIILVSVFTSKSNGDFVESLLLAIGCAILLASYNLQPIWVELQGVPYNVQFIYNYIFIILGISTLVLIFVTFRRQYLIVTPTDFLMLVFPLLLLLVPNPYRDEYRLNVIGVRSFILFFAMQTTIKRHRQTLRRFRLVILLALIYVSLISIFGMRIIYKA